MNEIHSELLWIGNAFDVRQSRTIFDAGIAAVVDVAYEEPPAQVPRQLMYCRFPLNDGGGNDPVLLFQTLLTATNFIRAEIRTLIACSAGLSRSPTVAAFALAHHLDEDPDSVLSRIADIKALELNPDLWADMHVAFSKLPQKENREDRTH